MGYDHTANIRQWFKEEDLGRPDAHYRFWMRKPPKYKQGWMAQKAAFLICQDRLATGWEYRQQAMLLSNYDAEATALWKQQAEGSRRTIKETTARYSI